MREQAMDRRSVLKASGAAGTTGLLGVAGCLGIGGGNGTTEISVATAQGSSASELLAGLRRVVHNQSDSVRLLVQETQGDPANARAYDDGNVQAYTMSNYNVILAHRGSGPFADRGVDRLAHQGIRIAAYDLHWVKRAGTNIQSTADLPGKNLYCLPPGWGFRQMVENVHNEAGMWENMQDNVLNLSTSDVPGAFAEGRIDASIFYSTNQKGLPGFQREADARVDLEFVAGGDQYISGIEGISSVFHQTPGNEKMTAMYEQDMGDADPIHTMAQGAQLFFGNSVSPEAAQEVARISHEHADKIIEGFGQYPDHSNIELMYDLWLTDPKLPIHPGMANFLEENGQWNGDEWDRADLD